MARLMKIAPRPRHTLPPAMLPLLAFDQFEDFSFIATCHLRTPLTKPIHPSVANAAEGLSATDRSSVPVMLMP